MTLYEELCSYKNLEKAFLKARKGKTQKQYVIDFEKKLKENLLELRAELLMYTYKPRPLKTFILRDPKTRKISKSDFRDRVVHHAIVNIIEHFFEKRFIFDSYANRVGKGTLGAIKRFDVFKRKVSKNNSRTCFVLKADIKSYFDTVNHKILINILQEQIQDSQIVWLIKVILDNHQGKLKGKGMPLGNLTSQFFANVYLNELDQFVKHNLKATYYIRYVDDFVILSHSKKLLKKYKDEIDGFLKNKLDITLHPEKSKIVFVKKGVHFLGLRIFYYHTLLAKKNMRKFNKKLFKMQDKYSSKSISREDVVERFEGWMAYVTNANTYKYRKKITGKFNQLFPVQPKTQISFVKKHENFNKKIESSKIDFSSQKTLMLFNKKLSIKQISKRRNINENTVWKHLADLAGHNQLSLKKVMNTNKIRAILNAINSPNNNLKEIKKRVNDDSITYNEIAVILEVVKSKHKKRNVIYCVSWYQKTNCFRKCYYNKHQQKVCRINFQKLILKQPNLEFTRNEFLDFFNNHVNICVLSDKEKRKHVTWKDFKKKIKPLLQFSENQL